MKVYKSEGLYWLDDGDEAMDFKTAQEVQDFIERGWPNGIVIEWDI